METIPPSWLVLAVLLSAANAQAQPGSQPFALSDAVYRGATTVRWLGIPLYEASLWVEPGTPAGQIDYARAFVLRIRYARPIAGRTLADASRDEIARLQAPPPDLLSEWHARMLAVFPDVERGTEIAGMHVPGVGIRFFLNGGALAEVPGDDFSRAFFGIWFDARARNSSGRNELLGGGRL